MVSHLLLANLLHGSIALIWVGGIRRLAGPISPSLFANLLALALLLPIVVAAAHLFGAPGLPDPWLVLRVDMWAQAVGSATPLVGFFGVLVAGTLIIVVVQEIAPAWSGRHRRLAAERGTDPRLDVSMRRVDSAFARLGRRRLWGRPPTAVLLRSPRKVAALHGVIAPRVMVSRGLLDLLDDDELDAVIAHELAHLHRGGNVGLFLIWLVRMLQAASPPALVIFRQLVEAQEQACDALAARALGRSSALAAALLKVYQGAAVVGEAGALERARAEVQHRSNLVTTRLRVRALLDNPTAVAPSPIALAVATLGMGALLWSIG